MASCETFASKCKFFFSHATALSKATFQLDVFVPDVLNGATVQQQFDEIYPTVSNVNELSENQKWNSTCKGPFEYGKALTWSPNSLFLKLQRMSRVASIKPSEYLVLRYQKTDGQVTHFYLVAFITSKNTINPSQAVSSCCVLNLYLNRWSFISSNTRAMYSFVGDIENN